jgi:L-amino acid N-acyltransferase YncA
MYIKVNHLPNFFGSESLHQDQYFKNFDKCENLAQDRDQWWALVKMEMNLWVP